MNSLIPMLAISSLVAAAPSVGAAESGSTDAATAKGFLGKSVAVEGKDIKYVVYIPPSYDPKTPMPTIIFLNGRGECGTDGWKQVAVGLGRSVLLDVSRWPFIVIFPQKQVATDNWEDEDAMVMAALEQTRRDYNVDPSRIYLTGLSQGGHGTWAIAAKHPDLFAAIAPICGWGDQRIASKLTKMPIWVFHGEKDDVVSVERSKEMERYLQEAGGSCKLTIYPGVGHGSWDAAYAEPDLPAWFLRHRIGIGDKD